MSTLDAYGLIGIVNLRHAMPARYVAVVRNGFINLKEVQLYQQPSEFHKNTGSLFYYSTVVCT